MVIARDGPNYSVPAPELSELCMYLKLAKACITMQVKLVTLPL